MASMFLSYLPFKFDSFASHKIARCTNKIEASVIFYDLEKYISNITFFRCLLPLFRLQFSLF